MTPEERAAEFEASARDETIAAAIDAIRAKHQARCALCGEAEVRPGIDHEVWIATWTRSGHVLGRKPETWCANCARLDQLTATGA